MSRSLKDVHPIIGARAIMLRDSAHKEGLWLTILSTLRTYEEQEALYAQGRTAPGKIVTNAKPGESVHNFGLALDFAILDKTGAIDWRDIPAYRTVGELGEELGFQWGGRFKTIIDYPHMQMSFGFAIQDLRTMFALGGIERVWKECSRQVDCGAWKLKECK